VASGPLRDLAAVNDQLAGARIERVLVGLGGSDNLLVIHTDRHDPDTGSVLQLHVTGWRDVRLIGGLLLTVPPMETGA
jgi:hypothetical protein